MTHLRSAGPTALLGALLAASLTLSDAPPVSAQEAGPSTLHEAVAAGDTVRVKALLRADPSLLEARDATGRTALFAAAQRGDAGMVRLLLGRGADVMARENQGRTPLFAAANWGRSLDAVTLLLDAGADVNDRTPGGEEILFSTLFYGSPQVIALLLDRGARLPSAPPLLARALYLSAANGLQGVFDMAVAQADAVGMEWGRMVPLHAAARGGSVAIGKALVAEGAPLDAPEAHGVTPLQIAAENGRLDFVEWLAEEGANLDAASPSGMKALDFARAHGHASVVARLLELGATPEEGAFPELSGPWLGQPAPTDGPAMFAPGIVSGHDFDSEHSPIVFSPDGTEAFWGSPYRRPIMGSRVVDGRWTRPEPAPFNSSFSDGEAIFSPDGRRVYFLSTRPLAPDVEPGGEKVWFVEREGAGWSQARPASAAVNAFDHHWLISVSGDGTLYFSAAAEGGFGDRDLWRAPMVDGAHGTPENLGPVINTAGTELTPFIAPDERYLLFASRGQPPADGRFRLYVSFREMDGSWSTPRALDAVTGGVPDPLCPAVTPDGKYMSFIGGGDIWWVRADFLEAIRAPDAM